MRDSSEELRLVGVLELLCGALQVATEVLTSLYNLVSSGTPLLHQVLEPISANALPVVLKLARVVLNVWLDLVLNLVIELDENLTELTHQVGIYVNNAH
jgi:hypothetical protein